MQICLCASAGRPGIRKRENMRDKKGKGRIGKDEEGR